MGLPIDPQVREIALATKVPDDVSRLRPELKRFAKTFKFGDDEALCLLRRLCKGFDTPLAKKVDLMSRNDPKSILDLYVDPTSYECPYQYFADRQVWAFLSKYPFSRLSSADDRKGKALKSVVESEEQCRITNRRFVVGKHTDYAQRVIMTAQRKIAKWLGCFNVQEVLDASRFGPGLTRGLDDSKRVSFYHKISGRPTATPSLKPFLWSFFREFPGWARSAGFRGVVDDYGTLWFVPDVDISPHNRVTTVPKTALTDRPIAIENEINQFLQLGTGQSIRRRLRRVGIDLEHGQAIHRELAKLGSIHPWLISTIDLSAASDTVAYRVVETLLPPDWFYWLNLLRAPSGLMPDGSELVYEKFSSMGNGFTFELETLIFLALVHATYDVVGLPIDEHLVKVYGDDIICTTDVVPPLFLTLEAFGFRVNHKKSFFTLHPFRESCGADYFSGVAVRPLYLTESISDAAKLLEAHNRLYEVSAGGFNTTFADDRYRFASLYLVDRVPSRLRDGLRAPPGVEGGLWSPPALLPNRSVYDEQLQRYVMPCVHLAFCAHTETVKGLAGIIHSAERSSTSGRISLRGAGQLRLRYTWDPVPVDMI